MVNETNKTESKVESNLHDIPVHAPKRSHLFRGLDPQNASLQSELSRIGYCIPSMPLRTKVNTGVDKPFQNEFTDIEDEFTDIEDEFTDIEDELQTNDQQIKITEGEGKTRNVNAVYQQIAGEDGDQGEGETNGLGLEEVYISIPDETETDDLDSEEVASLISKAPTITAMNRELPTPITDGERVQFPHPSQNLPGHSSRDIPESDSEEDLGYVSESDSEEDLGYVSESDSRYVSSLPGNVSSLSGDIPESDSEEDLGYASSLSGDISGGKELTGRNQGNEISEATVTQNSVDPANPNDDLANPNDDLANPNDDLANPNDDLANPNDDVVVPPSRRETTFSFTEGNEEIAEEKEGSDQNVIPVLSLERILTKNHNSYEGSDQTMTSVNELNNILKENIDKEKEGYNIDVTNLQKLINAALNLKSEYQPDNIDGLNQQKGKLPADKQWAEQFVGDVVKKLPELCDKIKSEGTNTQGVTSEVSSFMREPSVSAMYKSIHYSEQINTDKREPYLSESALQSMWRDVHVNGARIRFSYIIDGQKNTIDEQKDRVEKVLKAEIKYQIRGFLTGQKEFPDISSIMPIHEDAAKNLRKEPELYQVYQDYLAMFSKEKLQEAINAEREELGFISEKDADVMATDIEGLTKTLEKQNVDMHEHLDKHKGLKSSGSTGVLEAANNSWKKLKEFQTQVVSYQEAQKQMNEQIRAFQGQLASISKDDALCLVLNKKLDECKLAQRENINLQRESAELYDELYNSGLKEVQEDLHPAVERKTKATNDYLEFLNQYPVDRVLSLTESLGSQPLNVANVQEQLTVLEKWSEDLPQKTREFEREGVKGYHRDKFAAADANAQSFLEIAGALMVADPESSSNVRLLDGHNRLCSKFEAVVTSLEERQGQLLSDFELGKMSPEEAMQELVKERMDELKQEVRKAEELKKLEAEARQKAAEEELVQQAELVRQKEQEAAKKAVEEMLERVQEELSQVELKQTEAETLAQKAEEEQEEVALLISGKEESTAAEVIETTISKVKEKARLVEGYAEEARLVEGYAEEAQQRVLVYETALQQLVLNRSNGTEVKTSESKEELKGLLIKVEEAVKAVSVASGRAEKSSEAVGGELKKLEEKKIAAEKEAAEARQKAAEKLGIAEKEQVAATEAAEAAREAAEAAEAAAVKAEEASVKVEEASKAEEVNLIVAKEHAKKAKEHEDQAKENADKVKEHEEEVNEHAENVSQSLMSYLKGENSQLVVQPAVTARVAAVTVKATAAVEAAEEAAAKAAEALEKAAASVQAAEGLVQQAELELVRQKAAAEEEEARQKEAAEARQKAAAEEEEARQKAAAEEEEARQKAAAEEEEARQKEAAEARQKEAEEEARQKEAEAEARQKEAEARQKEQEGTIRLSATLEKVLLEANQAKKAAEAATLGNLVRAELVYIGGVSVAGSSTLREATLRKEKLMEATSEVEKQAKQAKEAAKAAEEAAAKEKTYTQELVGELKHLGVTSGTVEKIEYLFKKIEEAAKEATVASGNANALLNEAKAAEEAAVAAEKEAAEAAEKEAAEARQKAAKEAAAEKEAAEARQKEQEEARQKDLSDYKEYIAELTPLFNDQTQGASELEANVRSMKSKFSEEKNYYQSAILNLANELQSTDNNGRTGLVTKYNELKDNLSNATIEHNSPDYSHKIESTRGVLAAKENCVVIQERMDKTNKEITKCFSQDKLGKLERSPWLTDKDKEQIKKLRAKRKEAESVHDRAKIRFEDAKTERETDLNDLNASLTKLGNDPRINQEFLGACKKMEGLLYEGVALANRYLTLESNTAEAKSIAHNITQGNFHKETKLLIKKIEGFYIEDPALKEDRDKRVSSYKKIIDSIKQGLVSSRSATKIYDVNILMAVLHYNNACRRAPHDNQYIFPKVVHVQGAQSKPHTFGWNPNISVKKGDDGAFHIIDKKTNKNFDEYIEREVISIALYKVASTPKGKSMQWSDVLEEARGEVQSRLDKAMHGDNQRSGAVENFLPCVNSQFLARHQEASYSTTKILSQKYMSELLGGIGKHVDHHYNRDHESTLNQIRKNLKSMIGETMDCSVEKHKEGGKQVNWDHYIELAAKMMNITPDALKKSYPILDKLNENHESGLPNSQESEAQDKLKDILTSSMLTTYCPRISIAPYLQSVVPAKLSIAGGQKDSVLEKGAKGSKGARVEKPVGEKNALLYTYLEIMNQVAADLTAFYPQEGESIVVGTQDVVKQLEKSISTTTSIPVSNEKQLNQINKSLSAKDALGDLFNRVNHHNDQGYRGPKFQDSRIITSEGNPYDVSKTVDPNKKRNASSATTRPPTVGRKPSASLNSAPVQGPLAAEPALVKTKQAVTRHIASGGKAKPSKELSFQAPKAPYGAAAKGFAALHRQDSRNTMG